MTKHCPMPWRLTLLVIYFAAVWVVLSAIEKKINPIGWDLKMLDSIHNLQQQTAKRSDE